jgi:hypothetical protein
VHGAVRVVGQDVDVLQVRLAGRVRLQPLGLQLHDKGLRRLVDDEDRLGVDARIVQRLQVHLVDLDAGQDPAVPAMAVIPVAVAAVVVVLAVTSSVVLMVLPVAVAVVEVVPFATTPKLACLAMIPPCAGCSARIRRGE